MDMQSGMLLSARLMHRELTLPLATVRLHTAYIALPGGMLYDSGALHGAVAPEACCK